MPILPKTRLNKFRSWSLLLLALLFTAALPLTMPPPGLEEPEPIGKFLNGNLPALTPGGGADLSWDTEIAYPDLRFEEPIFIQPHPFEQRLFVASRLGYIETFVDRAEASEKEMLLDLRDKIAVVWDGGLMGIALHPEFGQSGSPNRNYFYVYYTAKGPDGRSGPNSCQVSCFSCYGNADWFGSYLRLSRFQLSEGTYEADSQSEQILLNIRQYNGTHRGGGMVFGPDGFLYLAIGDQARYDGAQNIEDNLEGGVLRLDVDLKGGSISHPPRRKMGQHAGFSGEQSGANYYIPNDNPWIRSDSSVFEEYWAIGLRNPHRMTKDAFTGKIWIGDVGQTLKEEIDILEKEANYGWPLYEASVGPIPRCTTDEVVLGKLTAPEQEISRQEVACMIGGYVYRGNKHPALFGSYVYGGCVAKRIYALNGNGEISLLTTFGPAGYIMTFGEDTEQEILIGRQHDSTHLYRLVTRNANPPAPQKLSQTGAFKDLNTLEPNSGVLPYDMIEDFWSDGASKKRWMAIPNDGSHDTDAEQIRFSKTGNWEFPVGTVLIKHFELGAKRLETRFEVLGADGEYYYLSYKWNESQTDADLLKGAVDESIVVNGKPQNWHYPSRSECLSCHQENAGFVLGLKTRYLNKEITYPQTGIQAQQLLTLSHLGILDAAISEADLDQLPRLSSFDDPGTSLEEKARAYLDLNCSYCHQPGTNNRASFDTRLTTPLSRQGLIHGGVHTDLGIAGAQVILPGDSTRSILLHRINSTEEGISMPPLAKNVVDSQGFRILSDWIKQLPATDNLGGTGLQATYFSDDNLSELAFERIDPALEFSWTDEASNPGLSTDNFSVRWEARIQSSQSGPHTFYIKADEGARVWMGTELLINEWENEQQKEWTLERVLGEAEQIPLRLEFRQTEGDAIVELSWSGPNMDKQIIPREHLFPLPFQAPGDLGGKGLRGTYFEGINFQRQLLQRIDPQINFNWGLGSPAPNIFANNFSVRWEGNLEVNTEGTYTFFTTSNDGVRLWVDGQLIIDKFIDQSSREWTGKIDLAGDQSIAIQLEYYEHGDIAEVALRWEGPGIFKQIVPQSHLFPPGEISENRTGIKCTSFENGEMILEAENYTSLYEGTGNAQWNVWKKISDGKASGGFAMQAAPNFGIQAQDLKGPRMDYNLYFSEAGTYRVFTRSFRAKDQDGSFYLGLDGKLLTSLQGKGLGYQEAWGWEGYAEGKALEIYIAEPGKHQLNVWMREDGVGLDKFIIKKDPEIPKSIGNYSSPQINCSDRLELFTLSEFGQDLLLSWSLYEAGRATFSLERSVDKQEFELLETGPLSKGYHTYRDTGLWRLDASLIQYQIKVMDRAGQVLESYQRALALSQTLQPVSFFAWPNPAQEKLNISFENPNRKELSLRVLNLQGQEIHQIKMGELERNGSIELKVDKWLDGMYILILSDGLEMATQKLLIKH